MSEQELNSYRFGRSEDPTDEMLEAIMKDACEQAKERARKAEEAYQIDGEIQYAQLHAKWHTRINNALNGVY